MCPAGSLNHAIALGPVSPSRSDALRVGLDVGEVVLVGAHAASLEFVHRWLDVVDDEVEHGVLRRCGPVRALDAALRTVAVLARTRDELEVNLTPEELVKADRFVEPLQGYGADVLPPETLSER